MWRVVSHLLSRGHISTKGVTVKLLNDQGIGSGFDFHTGFALLFVWLRAICGHDVGVTTLVEGSFQICK